MRLLVSHEAVSVSPLISSSLFVSLIVFATSDLVLACPVSCWFPLTRLRARGVFLQDRKSTGVEVVDHPAYHLWWECIRDQSTPPNDHMYTLTGEKIVTLAVTFWRRMCVKPRPPQ